MDNGNLEELSLRGYLNFNIMFLSKRSFFLSFISISLIFFSCQNNETNSNLKSGENLLAFLKDSVVIESGGNNFENRIAVLKKGGEYNLSIFKPRTGDLVLLNLSNKSSKKISGFPHNKAAYWIDESGSIYALMQDQNKVIQYSPSGAMVKQFNLNTLSLSKSYKFWSNENSLPFCINSRNEIIVSADPVLHVNVPEERELYFKTKTLAILQIQKDTIVLTDEFAPYPTAYTKNFYGIDQQPVAAYKNPDVVGYMFNNKPAIYEYNIPAKTGKERIIRNLEANSLSEYSKEEVFSVTYTKKYATENNLNLKLLYDGKNNRYILIRSLKHNYIGSDSLLVEYYDKQFEVSVIKAENYSVSKKYYLDNKGVYFLFRSFMYEGSLYLPRFVNNNKEPLIIDKYDI